MLLLEELERSIIEQELDPNGILTLIRDDKFDNEKCRTLIDTIAEYSVALGQQEYISREIAGYLWSVEDQFLVTTLVVDRDTSRLDMRQKVKATYPEILRLMNEIFDVTRVTIPSLDSLEISIIAQWENQDGLMPLLREYICDTEKCQKFINTLNAYQQSLGDRKYLNRKIVGCLRLFEIAFATAEAFYSSEADIVATRSEVGRNIHVAYAEIWGLMNDTFFPRIY